VVTDTDAEFSWNNTDSSGLFDNTTAGDHEVLATYEGITSQSVTVTVGPAEVSTVEIEPALTQIITAGEIIDFDARALDNHGNIITDTDTDFSWNNTPADGSFDNTTAAAYEVSARYGEITSVSVEVTVVPAEVSNVEIEPSVNQTITAGETIDFSAEGFDEYGNLNTSDNTEFSWENTDSEGLFNETKVGKYNITASFEEISSDDIAVTVEPASPDRLDIYPQEVTIAAGDSQDFDSQAFDPYDNEIGEVTEQTSWSIDDDAGGHWDNNTYVSENPGEWNITAEYDGITKKTLISVSEHGIDYIEVTPDGNKITAGETQEFISKIHNESEGEIGRVSAVYSIEEGAGGSWQNNIYTSEYAGEWTVTAEHDGMTDQVILTVEAGEVDSITITPEEDQNISSGEEIDFSAEAYDEFDNIITNNDQDFTWRAEGAPIDGSGLFSEGEPGIYNITAEYNERSSKSIKVDVNARELWGSIEAPIQTETRDIELELTAAEGVTHVLIGSKEDMSDAEKFVFEDRITYQLEDKPGNQTLYIRFVDEDNGIESNIYHEDIYYHDDGAGEDKDSDDDEKFFGISPMFILLGIVLLVILILALILISKRSSESYEEVDVVEERSEEEERGKYDMTDEEKHEIDLPEREEMD
ncbi:MAG: hypothetical protein KGY76_06555, partial [Candidatus Thermoplasmatota archaeon]|nr:hypothetical protein [Candidatus Thermoplasmatota archaeon]